MSYLSLARKYRPHTFADLVGQESVGLALGNAIRLKREPRGVIFTGVRGIGKTTTARIYAKALNCEEGPQAEPCNVCASCLAIQHGSHEDVLEIDGASNTGVDDVRALQETLAYVPQRSPFKIYIIDEVHMLSVSAFNALLKTLEEPPEHVVFIFATTELHKVPETIQSRCQIFHLQKISTQLTKKRIADILAQENIPFEERAIQWIAREGKGSLRDALTLLDQVIAIGDGSVHWAAVEPMANTGHAEPIYELLKMLLQKNSLGILEVIARWDQEGLSMPILVEELVKACRNAFVLKTVQGQSTELDLLDLEEREQQALKLLGQEAPLFDLNRLFRTFVKCLDDLRHSELDRFVIENYALEWCLDPGLPDLTALFQGQANTPAVNGSVADASPVGAQSAQVSAAAPISSGAPQVSLAAPKVEGSVPGPVDLRNRWKQTSGQMANSASSSPSPVKSEAGPVASMAAAAAVPSPRSIPEVKPSAASAPKSEINPASAPASAVSDIRPESYSALATPAAPIMVPRSDSENKPLAATATQSDAGPAATLPPAVGSDLTSSPATVSSLLKSELAASAIPSYASGPARTETYVPPKPYIPSASVGHSASTHSIPMAANQVDFVKVQQAFADATIKVSPESSLSLLESSVEISIETPSTPVPTAQQISEEQLSKSPSFAERMSQKSMEANTKAKAQDASAAHRIAQSKELPGAGKPVPDMAPKNSTLDLAPQAIQESKLWPESWKHFVEEWKKQKPLQARVLEETYSLEYGPERIKLAVEAESLAGQKLLHIDTRRKLLVHFEQLFGFKGNLEVVPKNELTPSTDNSPEFRETLLETKQKVKAREREDLKALLRDHPLTREAILAFDGTIEAIEVQ